MQDSERNATNSLIDADRHDHSHGRDVDGEAISARFIWPTAPEALDVTAAVSLQGELTVWQYRSNVNGQGEGEIHQSSRDDAPFPYRLAAAYRADATDATDPVTATATALTRSTVNPASMPAAAYTFARESFIDELAFARGEDALAFRLARLHADGSNAASTLIAALGERAVWAPRRSPPSATQRARRTTSRGRGFAFDRQADAAGQPDFSAWIVDLDVDAGTGDVVVHRVLAGRATGDLSNALANETKAALLQPYSAERIAGELSLAMGTPLSLLPSHDDTALYPPSSASGASGSLTVSPQAFSFRTAMRLPSQDSAVTWPQAPATSQQTPVWMTAAASPAVAAVANALFDATGVRFRAPPFTPETIRSTLQNADARDDAVNIEGQRHKQKRWRLRDLATTRGVVASVAAGVTGLALSAAAALSIDGWLNRPLAPIARPSATTWSAETIERGRLIATAGDCAVCHTASNGAVNAGGRAIDTPFGEVYSTNLTPDEKTGIGNWSFDAFSRAMREGISRDGRHLYPAFPYTAFTKLSEADMTALYAYLMAQPAVHAPVPSANLRFPFNQRALMAGWNALFLKQGAFEPDPARSAQWNRGAYLVEGLGHCSACHSPRNALGAERGGLQYLSGGTVDGWTAPSLVGDSNSPVKWTESALFDYLKRGYSTQHGVAAGPMAPVVAGLSTLPDSDVRAIAHYVASLSSKPGTSTDAPVVAASVRASSLSEGDIRNASVHDVAVAPVALRTASTASTALRTAASVDADNAFASGRRIFQGACAVCHAEHGGVGNFGVRPLMSLNTSVSEALPDNLLLVIQHGIDAPATDGLGYMPGFRDHLDDRQIADLANYIRARFAPTRPAWKDVEQASTKIRQRSATSAHEAAYAHR